MLPVFELRGADIEIASGDPAQQYILRSDAKIADPRYRTKAVGTVFTRYAWQQP
jgi:hypothetical protein